MGKHHRRDAHPEEPLPYLRALGDPDRLKIVQTLRDGPKSVGDICKELDTPIANVSHHLHALKDVGVVSARKQGRFVIYELNHVAESRNGGTQVFDFGCVRIEFGEGRGAAPSVRATRPEDEALMILNRMVGKVGAPAGAAAATKPAAPRAARRGAGTLIEIENASFESPATPFFDTAVPGWEKEGDPSSTGVFRNFPDDTPIPGSRFVKNADGDQLATVAARQAGLFQSLGGVAYTAGTTYTISVSVGVSSVQPPTENAEGVAPTLRVAMTFTDASGRRHETQGVGVESTKLRADRLKPISFTVEAASLPAACLGRAVGVLLSTACNGADHAGHFIVDDVQLVAVAATAPVSTTALPRRRTRTSRG